ncbi:MAG TPA: hypothetical protein DIW80_23715 [Gordonia polyisoprenivorans]|nr:hypothetical protein [Gordonia polyisoprenivorans]
MAHTSHRSLVTDHRSTDNISILPCVTDSSVHPQAVAVAQPAHRWRRPAILSSVERMRCVNNYGNLEW